jgi:hypothetical protein
MAEIDTSIYKQQPAGGIGAMNPLQILDMASRAQDFQSQNQINQLLRQSIDPATGQPDPNAFRQGLANSGANRGVQNALTGMRQYEVLGQQQRQTTADADTAQINATNAWRNSVYGQIAPLAFKDTITQADLNEAEARAAQIPPGTNGMDVRKLHQWFAGFNLNDQVGTKQRLGTLITQLAGPAAGIAERTTGVVAGQPITGTAGQAVQQAVSGTGAKGTPPGYPTAMAPGYREQRAAGAQRAGELVAAGSAAPGQKTALSQFIYDVDRMDGKMGATLPIERIINTVTQRLAGTGITLNKDELAAADSMEKVTHMLAGQLARSGHSSDQYLQNAYGANPNIKMSDLGARGVAGMLTGDAAANQIKMNAWLDHRATDPNADFDLWNRNFNRSWDPRIFQLLEMPDNETKQKYIKSLGRDGDLVLNRLHEYSNRTDPNGRGWLEDYGIKPGDLTGAAPITAKPVKTITVTKPPAAQ